MYDLVLEKKESKKKGVADYYVLSVKKDYDDATQIVTFEQPLICGMFDVTPKMLSLLFKERDSINMGAVKGYDELLTLMTLKKVEGK